jgi:cytochrome bd ubiquinol oxidase subunit II
MVQRSMGPVWEANHVWLIFVLVVAWTAFPVAFGSVMSTLYVPLFIAAAGIILRGTGYALRGETNVTRGGVCAGRRVRTGVGADSFCLGAAVGGITCGRVPVGDAAGSALESWLNPTSIALGVLAVMAGAYLAAVYMAADAKREGLVDLERMFLRRALAAAIAAGAVAIGALLVLRFDGPGSTTGSRQVAEWSACSDPPSRAR